MSELLTSSRLLALIVASAFVAGAQGQFFPLDQVRPGMRGVGRTVFSGDRIEEFQVEVLGVLKNPGPKQSIVLARLSGGPLAETGVLQGMSGSPVYLDGKLLGAVALGFPFSKQPIAGIQPIGTMIEGSSLPPRAALRPELVGRHYRYPIVPTSPAPTAVREGELAQVRTPLSLSGFAATTAEVFASQFAQLGFQPTAGLQTGSAANASSTVPIVPGSMISVGLLTGDMNIVADGTVTYVDGKKIYAFGHRFLDTGTTELPFAHSEVIASVPNLNSSFKVSVPQGWAGTILSDRASAISGEIGREAHTVPLRIAVHSAATGTHTYRFQVVNDRFLTPFVTQTALFSVLDATERTIGAGTLELKGKVQWETATPPLLVQDAFISDSNLIQQVSADAVVPLAFVLGAGFQGLRPKEISFELEARESKQQLRIGQAWTSGHEVRPGDTISISILLQGENGFELTRTAQYRIPTGTPAGPLNLTVSDANTINFPEFAGLAQSASPSPEALLATINSFRDSESCYVRVWRAQPSFSLTGTSHGELTDPPPSVALILGDPSDSITSNAALTATRGSELAELSIPLNGYVVTGAKTLQVEVKE